MLPHPLLGQAALESLNCIAMRYSFFFSFFLHFASGRVCTFDQLERVREMQEQLARLHFSLDVCADELREETHAERNLEQLLNNVSHYSCIIRCTKVPGPHAHLEGKAKSIAVSTDYLY